MAKSTLFSGTTGGTIKDTDIMAYKEEGASGDPKRIHLFSVMKSYFQGLLPDRVTQNELDISVLRPSAGTANQFVSAGGLFIPLYIYPGNIYTNDDFNQVIDIARANNSLNVLTTINPGNGPGTVADGNYTVAIDRLHSAGVVVTGYVSTAYTANTIEDVKLDIDKWIELYPEIDGIFLDEMTNDAVVAHYEYYQELTTYTKQSGLTITISNPGSTCGRPYFDYNCADIIFTREVSTFPTVAEAHEDWADGAASYFNKRRGLIVYNNTEVDAFAGLDEIYPYYGWFYVTDDDLPNPYDTLPTYFESLANKVSGLGTSTPTATGIDTLELQLNNWSDTYSSGDADKHIFIGRNGMVCILLDSSVAYYNGVFWDTTPTLASGLLKVGKRVSESINATSFSFYIAVGTGTSNNFQWASNLTDTWSIADTPTIPGGSRAMDGCARSETDYTVVIGKNAVTTNAIGYVNFITATSATPWTYVTTPTWDVRQVFNDTVNQRMIAIGIDSVNGNQIYYSQTGYNLEGAWTALRVPSYDEFNNIGLSIAQSTKTGKIVMLCTDYIVTFDDVAGTITDTQVWGPLTPNSSIIYNEENDAFIIVEGTGDSGDISSPNSNVKYSKDDGVTWTSLPALPDGAEHIAYAVRGDCFIATSTNSTNDVFRSMKVKL